MGFASCGRVEEAPDPSRLSTPRAEPRPTTSGAAAVKNPEPVRERTDDGATAHADAASAVEPNRCVVATPAQAPPRAKRAAKCPPDPGMPPELARGHVTFVEARGKPRIEVELARDTPSRTRGLMYRTSMPADHGMLFSWAGTQRIQSFWMRNTCIPLDMLFVASDGTITGILEQVPTLNEDPRTIPCPVEHVLEVNAGYCRSHGIRAGQKLAIEP
jgi:uncharacterized membrane protein (UPF0127 family)